MGASTGSGICRRWRPCYSQHWLLPSVTPPSPLLWVWMPAVMAWGWLYFNSMENRCPQYTVASASHTVTDRELRYAQLEKECLVSVWASEWFSSYPMGLESIHLMTGTKPLVPMFKKVRHRSGASEMPETTHVNEVQHLGRACPRQGDGYLPTTCQEIHWQLWTFLILRRK